MTRAEAEVLVKEYLKTLPDNEKTGRLANDLTWIMSDNPDERLIALNHMKAKVKQMEVAK